MIYLSILAEPGPAVGQRHHKRKLMRAYVGEIVLTTNIFDAWGTQQMCHQC